MHRPCCASMPAEGLRPSRTRPACPATYSAHAEYDRCSRYRATIGPMEAVMTDEPDYTRRWLINASGAAILSSAVPVTASNAQTAAAASPGFPTEVSGAAAPISPVTTALADYVANT